jgi:NADH-quinone oxidoreductase subunit C
MLRDDPDLGFDFLDFVSAVDRKEDGLEVVVQLYSTKRRHRARVKVVADATEPRVPSIHDLYPGANWHERETWELFGIDFEGHPQLVKLLLPEPFEGHPLRKDFVLMSRMAKPWPGEEKAEGEE